MPRWEREPSAAAQQVRRVYGHTQKLEAWLASASVSAEDGEALLEGMAALCQDQVSAAPNWPPSKAARALRTLLDHSAAQRAVAAAQEGEEGGPLTDALVACALAGRDDLLDVLLAAGARISVHTLAAAFPLRIGPAAFPGHFAPKLVGAARCDPLRAVRLLLARGAPQVPDCPVPHWHPLLRLVGDFKAERGEFGIQVGACSARYEWPGHEAGMCEVGYGACELHVEPTCAVESRRRPCMLHHSLTAAAGSQSQRGSCSPSFFTCPPAYATQISEAPCPSGQHVPRSLFDAGLQDFERMALTYLQATSFEQWYTRSVCVCV